MSPAGVHAIIDTNSMPNATKYQVSCSSFVVTYSLTLLVQFFHALSFRTPNYASTSTSPSVRFSPFQNPPDPLIPSLVLKK